MNASRGNFYWFRRGANQKQIGLILKRRGPWLDVRIWYDKPQRWGDPAPMLSAYIIGEVDPNEYQLRRALQFADADVRDVLLDSTKPKRKRKVSA